MRMATVILAAGMSTRMGTDKQLLPYGKETFLSATCRLYLPYGPVLVVLGHNKERILPALGNLPVQVVENPRYREGMSTSLAAGIRMAQSLDVTGIWLTFCDMPHLKPATLGELYQEAMRAPEEIGIPIRQGRRGHPVWLPRWTFGELLEETGDVGARNLVARHPERIRFPETGDPAVTGDIDSPELYLKLVEKRESDENSH